MQWNEEDKVDEHTQKSIAFQKLTTWNWNNKCQTCGKEKAGISSSHGNQLRDAHSGRLPCRRGSITASVGFDDTWHKATVCPSLKTTIYLAHFSDRVKQWIL